MMIQKERFGSNDREQFDDWLNSEKYELQQALGGSENMANFSYSAGSDAADKATPAAMVSTLVNTMLRDTCVKAYREA